MSKRAFLDSHRRKIMTREAAAPVAVVTSGGELESRVQQIVRDMERRRELESGRYDLKVKMDQLEERILENLFYIRDNKKELLPGRNYLDYLEQEIGLSKGFAYEKMRAYELCLEHDAKDLYHRTDYRVLAHIAGKKYSEAERKSWLVKIHKHLQQNEKFTREDFKKCVRRTFLPSAPIDKKGLKNWLLEIPKEDRSKAIQEVTAWMRSIS